MIVTHKKIIQKKGGESNDNNIMDSSRSSRYHDSGLRNLCLADKTLAILIE